MIHKRLIALVPETRPYLIKKVMVSWLSLWAGILLWFSVARLLDGVRIHGVNVPAAVRTFLAAGLCLGVRFVCTRVAASCTHQASACVKSKLRALLYAKLRRLGGTYTDAFPTSEVVQLAGEGVEQLESYFGNYLPQIFYALLAPLTLLGVFLPLSPLTAVVLFLCVPLIPAAIVSVQKVAKRLLGKYWDAYADLGDSFLENLQGLTTLKVYGADEARHQAMNEEAETFRKVTMKVLTMQLNSVTIMDLVAYGGTALGSVLAARTFAMGRVSMGEALAMILLSSEFFLAMRALGSYFHVAMNGMAASERMFRLLDLPEPQEGEKGVGRGGFQASRLGFSYEEGKPALLDVSVSIAPGSFVSVCGESGCGKSTLISLLSGDRQGYSGSLKIGGVELREVRREELRQQITVVPSNSYLFAGTVRDTLLEGDPNADEGTMREVLGRVNLLDFVEARGGLELALSERGSNLSGGQRQRLALARALLKDSPIYLFDEATSNIDAESEEDILKVIYALRGSHTVLMVSHRLLSGVKADEILYLEQGRLVQRGTHAALMASPGGYAALFRAQQRLENLGRKEGRPCEEVG